MSHILLIDDEPSIRKLLDLALTRAGHTVETAADGTEGIRKLEAEPVDVVVTDIRMPGLNGGAVLQHVQRSTSGAVPVIGISGTPWELEADGFAAVFPKPFSVNDLVRTIQNLPRRPVLPARAETASFHDRPDRRCAAAL